jgi:hypothetical protein
MKWSNMLAAFVMVLLTALTASAQVVAKRDITLRGCVVPGVEKDSFVITQTKEVTKDDQSAIPATMNGRHIIFWLNDSDELKDHVGRMVEVKGEIQGIEESEIEFKAGSHKDGGLIVEFEGPGDDVKVASEALGGAVGTSGTADGKNLKTFVIRIDVEDVDQVEGTCVQPTTR